jgi:hypothetical protein
MKNIYILLSISLTVLTGSLNAQFNQTQFAHSNETLMDNQAEKHAATLNMLINELESTFDVTLTFEEDGILLILSTNGSNNPYSVSLKDNNGKLILDGNLDPNMTQKVALNDLTVDNYLLRVSDMRTLKTTVYKVLTH